jgi:M6 family metalloprotease-like protein
LEIADEIDETCDAVSAFPPAMNRIPHLLPAIVALGLATMAGYATETFSTAPIPPLDSKGDVYKSEGVTDPLIYGSAVGRKKVIMVYLDFADAVMDIDTRERATKVLGGTTFDELFAKQSHGKLAFDIAHVHGWRRLPGKSGDYSSKTTDSHRELFVKIFELYPEVDFRDHDYIVANMPRIGNTAFGEREAIAIPYRGTRIKVAMNISSPSPYVLAHEVGHLMGLPDLYTYGGVEGPKNPAGAWDIMSLAGSATGFLGWHRHKLEWLDAGRKTYLTKSGAGLVLTPLDAATGISMVAIPVDDPARPSKVFVIEVAQARRLRDGKTASAGGVLVYTVDATLVSGHNPVVVYPKKGIDDAPFHPGDRFEDRDAPFVMEVLGGTPEDGYRIDIRFRER